MAYPRGGAWKRTGRLNGSDAGAKARKVWICNGCQTFNYQRWNGLQGRFEKPTACVACGRMDFAYFHSEGEAIYWARLLLLQRAGEIRGLRRQVPLALMTVGRAGLAVKWGELVVDYAYFDKEDVEHFVDYKPVAGASPDAALKIRCLEAAGTIVEIVNRRGAV